MARTCVIVGLGATLLFALWQLVTPVGFESVRGLNPRAVWEWRARARLGTFAVPLDPFTAVFRSLILVGWAAYAWLVWAIFRGGRFGARWTWPLAVPVVALLAVVMPACLSTDVFAYVGYARMAVVHGMNPHLHTQAELARLGDPTAAYLRWPLASPYGPLWTLASMAVVWAAPVGSVLGAVIAFKLIAGAALIATAFAARAMVRAVDPDRAHATFVLVAMNPLLLVEGPGSGHNDLVMIALVMLGFLLLSRQRPRAAALAIGAAAAVKVVPLMAVPWLAIVAMRAAAPSWRARVAAGAVIVGLALLPVCASYAPFWSGVRTLGGLAARWQQAESAHAGGASAGGVEAVGRADGSAPLAAGGSLPSSPSPSPSSSSSSSLPSPSRIEAADARVRAGRTRFDPMLFLARSWPALLAYAWAVLAMLLGRGDVTFRLMSVWSIVTLAVVLFVAGIWFPWYLAWLWPPLVTRLSRAHLALGLFVFVFSLLLSLVYAMPPG